MYEDASEAERGDPLLVFAKMQRRAAVRNRLVADAVSQMTTLRKRTKRQACVVWPMVRCRLKKNDVAPCAVFEPRRLNGRGVRSWCGKGRKRFLPCGSGMYSLPSFILCGVRAEPTPVQRLSAPRQPSSGWFRSSAKSKFRNFLVVALLPWRTMRSFCCRQIAACRRNKEGFIRSAGIDMSARHSDSNMGRQTVLGRFQNIVFFKS